MFENIDKSIDYEWVENFIKLSLAKKLTQSGLYENPELYPANVKVPGFYIILLPKSKMVYFGHSGDLRSRLKMHYFKLRHKEHRNNNLQKHFNNDNLDKIIFLTYITKTKEEANKIEDLFLKKYHGNALLTNIATDAFIAQNGMKHSEETRTKLRAGMARRIENGYGEKHSQKMLSYFSNSENREKQSAILKESWKDPDKRNRLLAASIKKKRPIVINDVIYDSRGDAAKQLCIPLGLIDSRLRSRYTPSWRYLNERH